MKLYQWRNTLFGINASTKRKMIPARYDWNMQALEAIIECANERGVSLNVYIPPIRTDVEVPYDLKEYETFKREVKEMAESTSVHFLDSDGIVPGELWGPKASTNSGGETRTRLYALSGSADMRFSPNALGTLVNDWCHDLQLSHFFFCFSLPSACCIGCCHRSHGIGCLFLSSLLFYAFWRWEYLSVLLLSAVVVTQLRSPETAVNSGISEEEKKSIAHRELVCES